MTIEQITPYILWALGLASLIAAGYIKQTRTAIHEAKANYQRQTDALGVRVSHLEVAVAAFGGMQSALSRFESQLADLAGITHRIAGHLGIK